MLTVALLVIDEKRKQLKYLSVGRLVEKQIVYIDTMEYYWGYVHSVQQKGMNYKYMPQHESQNKYGLKKARQNKDILYNYIFYNYRKYKWLYSDIKQMRN